MCMKLQNFEIFCYHSYNIQMQRVETVKISSVQKWVIFEN